MKKIVIASIAVASIVATSALAYGKGGCNMQGNQGYGMQKSQMKHHGMQKGMHKMGFMRLFAQLNLSEKQQTQLQKVMQESMKKRESMYAAFGKDSFDKEKFIKQSMNKKENMIKLRAETLEKAYNVLTKEQKNQLRVLMDLQEAKGINFDRYRNGRG